MEESVTDFRACPHCGGRLVAGATICLHCNEEVTSNKVESEGALGRFLVIALALIVILGGISGVAIRYVTDSRAAKAQQRVQQEQPAAPSAADPTVTCLEPTQESEAAALKAQGMTEVPGDPGKRCFSL